MTAKELRASTLALKAAGKLTHYGNRPKAPPVGIPACVHRGAPTGEREACGSCRGRVELKVFACAVHAEGCTVAKAVAGRKCCSTCPDRKAT